MERERTGTITGRQGAARLLVRAALADSNGDLTLAQRRLSVQSWRIYRQLAKSWLAPTAPVIELVTRYETAAHGVRLLRRLQSLITATTKGTPQ